MFADYRHDVCQVQKKKNYCCFGLVKAVPLQLVSELLDKVQWVYEMQKMQEVTQKKKNCCIDKCYMMVIK